MKLSILLFTIFITTNCFSQKLKLVTKNLQTDTANSKYKGMFILPVTVAEHIGGSNTFYLENAGTSDLIILRVESDIITCGSIQYPDQPIKAGASDSIVVHRNTCCYTDTAYQFLTVITNEKEQPGFPFIVRSIFSKPVFGYELSSNSIQFTADMDSIYTVQIKNTGNRNIKIQGISADNDFVFTNFSYKEYPVLRYDGINPGEAADLRFVIRKANPANKIDGGIVRVQLEPCFDKRLKKEEIIYFKKQ